VCSSDLIRALPGTVITGLTPQPLTVGPDGTASVELAAPAPYSLRAALGGYIPSHMTFYYQGEPEITLKQTRSPWLFIDAAFLDGFYPGVAATVATSPFPGFLRVGFTSFRIGLAVNGGDSIFSSLPLSQVTALAGIYLSPEDSPTRLYIGAGPLLRLSLPPDGSLVVDEMLPWGVQVVAGLELAMLPTLRFVLEYSPTVYATPQPTLFQNYFGGGSTFPFVTFPPSFALNALELRMGLRLAL
jgi:hypothetical protein